MACIDDITPRLIYYFSLMKSTLLVAFGGAIGSLARYFISLWIKQSYTYSFPWHTLLINISGCLLIGICYALSKYITSFETIRLLIMIGLLGGFTTFSSFGLETFSLFQSGLYLQAFSYILASNFAGILFVFLGFYFTNLLYR